MKVGEDHGLREKYFHHSRNISQRLVMSEQGRENWVSGGNPPPGAENKSHLESSGNREWAARNGDSGCPVGKEIVCGRANGHRVRVGRSESWGIEVLRWMLGLG